VRPSAEIVSRRLVELSQPEPRGDLVRLSMPLVTGLPTTVDLDAEFKVALVVPTGLAKTWRDADPRAIVSRSDGDRDPRLRANLELSAPSALTASAVAGGGSLVAGEYHYRVTALNASGESLPSDEASVTVPAASGRVALTWNAVAEATSYRVYRGRGSGEETASIPAATNALTDRGSVGRSGARFPVPPPPVGAVDHAPARLFLRRAGETIAVVPLVADRTATVPESGDHDRGAAVELSVLGWDFRAGSLRGPGDFGSRLEIAWRRCDRAEDRFEPPPVNRRAAERLAEEFRTKSVLGAAAGGAARTTRA
jgi:hypothetical protein